MKTITTLWILALLLSSVTQAASMLCTEDEMDAFKIGATDCQIGSVNNDKFNVGPDKKLQVNLDQIFTFSDWDYGMKYDFDDNKFDRGSTNINTNLFDYSGTNTTSSIQFTQSLNTLFPDITDAMIVIKSGGGQTTQPHYIAYSLNLLIKDFAFNSAFFNSKNGHAKDISHWTLYTRSSASTPPQEVPEPTPFFIFTLTIIGIALRRFQINNLKY